MAASSTPVNSKKQLVAVGVGMITAVGAVSTFVFKFTGLACDLPALKWLLAIGLVFACGFSCSLLAKFLAVQKKLDQFFAYGLCLVLYVLFIVVVFTKNCTPVPGARLKHQEKVEPRIAYQDNSVHQDNRKIIVHAAGPQKNLRDGDINFLKSRLTRKNSPIFVQQLASRPSDTLFQAQLIKALSALGFLHVFPSVAKTLPVNRGTGRLTISKDTIDGEVRYTLLINP